MNATLAMELSQGALTTSLLLLVPILGIALVVGLAVSVFQAVTQINEMTLTFVPKLVALFATLLLLGPWMLATMVDYSTGLFVLMAQMAR